MIYIPYISIVAAYVLVLLPRWLYVGKEMAKLEGGYNNNDPRAQQAQLTGVGRRALAAHHNAFEAFPPFSIGVLMAAQRGVKLEIVVGLCIAFVVARTVYMFAYVADKASVRSSMWTLGVLATAALMILAIAGVH